MWYICYDRWVHWASLCPVYTQSALTNVCTIAASSRVDHCPKTPLCATCSSLLPLHPCQSLTFSHWCPHSSAFPECLERELHKVWPFQFGFLHLHCASEVPHVFSWLDGSFLFIAGIDTFSLHERVFWKREGREWFLWAWSVRCGQSARPVLSWGTEEQSQAWGRGGPARRGGVGSACGRRAPGG